MLVRKRSVNTEAVVSNTLAGMTNPQTAVSKNGAGMPKGVSYVPIIRHIKPIRNTLSMSISLLNLELRSRLACETTHVLLVDLCLLLGLLRGRGAFAFCWRWANIVVVDVRDTGASTIAVAVGNGAHGFSAFGRRLDWGAGGGGGAVGGRTDGGGAVPRFFADFLVVLAVEWDDMLAMEIR